MKVQISPVLYFNLDFLTQPCTKCLPQECHMANHFIHVTWSTTAQFRRYCVTRRVLERFAHWKHKIVLLYTLYEWLSPRLFKLFSLLSLVIHMRLTNLYVSYTMFSPTLFPGSKHLLWHHSLGSRDQGDQYALAVKIDGIPKYIFVEQSFHTM